MRRKKSKENNQCFQDFWRLNNPVPTAGFNLGGLGGIVPAHGICRNERYCNIGLVPIFQLVEQVINSKT
jgi:hypothetical protein